MRDAVGLIVFETAIGYCALAWSARGVAGCQLPEPAEAGCRSLAAKRWPAAEPSAPPARAAAAVDDVKAMLAGRPRAIDFEALDLRAAEAFHQSVYRIAVRAPYGRTTTYGAIARELGDVSLSQAVGRALAANPIPILIPCHRVLGADGKVGGFSGGAGVATKLRLLNLEGADVPDDPPLFSDLPFAASPDGPRSLRRRPR